VTITKEIVTHNLLKDLYCKLLTHGLKAASPDKGGENMQGLDMDFYYSNTLSIEKVKKVWHKNALAQHFFVTKIRKKLHN